MSLRKLLLPVFVCLFFPFFTTAQNLGGNPASIKWQQINTNAARVIFPKGLDSQANRINNIISLLDNTTLNTIGTKQHKWNVVLLNQTTISNAYVRLAPVISEFNMVADQNNFSTGSLRVDDNLVIHENRHMQQFANFNSGLTKVFSFLLGQEGQLLANGLSIPDYFFEGDAVWQETLVSAQGRGRMPSFYNGLRSLALGNKQYSWMKLRSGSLKDYTPDHYELGYQLVAYGNEKYGTDFWRKVTTDAVHFKGLFYSFNKAIERYSAKTYPAFREGALAYFRQQTMLQPGTIDGLNYLTDIKKNTVADYLFPVFINDDSILVTKKSYKEVNAFYLLLNGKEKKIRVKNLVIDDYFSYNNGKVVYAAYQSDPRWGNRNYSNIQLLDIYNGRQRQLTFKSRYFSPDINKNATEIIAVNAQVNGANYLHRINAQTGELILQIPNPDNYLFTQTKYLDSNSAIAAVRNSGGEMALVKVNLTTGQVTTITPFSFNVVGYPFVKGDTVYYSKMDDQTPSDKIFAVTIKDNRIYRLTNNVTGIYQPAVNTKGRLVFSAFTADGLRLASLSPSALHWNPAESSTNALKIIGTSTASGKTGAGALYNLKEEKNIVTKYKKSFQLFNFHSWRPSVSDPEYGYTFYSDNILSSFSNNLTYTFNRNERSHTLGFNGVFAGWFPLLNLGAEESFNRHVDTAAGKSIVFNSAKIDAVISVPLSFVGGRTSKYFNFGTGYNIEKIFFRGNDKNVFNNEAIKYTSSFFSFSNVSRMAKQNINPAWAQRIALNYKSEINYRKSHKLVGSTSLYFPGLFSNHSFVINGAYQKRDSFPDLFSNTFSYSRGYEALSTRQMYKLGVNYHFPVCYPDWGFGNMVFFQRIRGNAFYDYTSARARLNGTLTDIKNRSTGGELYFDAKLWNALQASFGIRFSHLLDKDLINPGVKNRWEIIVPIGLIPN